ncbi:MAG: ATP-binding protein [Planctomycetota bacterium]
MHHEAWRAMQDFEKLGVFYLGKLYDLDARKAGAELLLYDSKDLTTHAVCVGMTGSGKTGLCLELLEEAAIDGIPAIAIDPKGDLSNLLLTFPDLKPEDFRPWIDPGEAARKSVTVEQLAEQSATAWREGLAQWGQTPDRIQRFRDAAEVCVYTPGSTSGLPITVLRSFAAPPVAERDEADSLRERIVNAVNGLLALLDVEADPLRSREHILLSKIFEQLWKEGKDLDIAGLIHAIQDPPLQKVGFMDLESFFPAKDRFALSLQLNNLVASPAFAAWFEGQPLDIGKLLHGTEGKPRIAILSIAHLSDTERMFFVTILLNEMIAWMRRQSGTSSLRALLYMDEVFGYFPPTANPPSKMPMLTLLKQARAYGLGIVLATQNPVDLDYKGLSNAGTWFIGRLQTERDKARVLDGLEGASSAAGHAFDRRKTETILSGLGNRVFLMNNVHDDQPVVFQTRWALSFLRGPMTTDQIRRLMEPRKPAAESKQDGQATPSVVASVPSATSNRPVLPPNVAEFFLAVDVPGEGNVSGGEVLYRPSLYAKVSLHFTNKKANVDLWREKSRLVLLPESLPDAPLLWEQEDLPRDEELDFSNQPIEGARFTAFPGELAKVKKYSEISSALKTHLYRTETLKLWSCPSLKAMSQPEESEADFRIRLSQAFHESRDAAVEKLRIKYAPKLAALAEKLRKAEQKAEKESAQATEQTFSAALSVGASILSALFGRKLASSTNVSKAATSMRAAGRAAREHADVSNAKETIAALQQQHADLEAEFKIELEKVQTAFSGAQIPLEEMHIQPKKTDISITQFALVWTPWLTGDNGRTLKAAFART